MSDPDALAAFLADCLVERRAMLDEATDLLRCIVKREQALRLELHELAALRGRAATAQAALVTEVASLAQVAS